MAPPSESADADVPASLLGAPAIAAIERFGDLAADRPALLAAAPRVFASSPWLGELCLRRESIVRELVETGELDATSAARVDDVAIVEAAFDAALDRASGLAQALDEAGELVALRRVRQRFAFAILWRMIAWGAAPETTIAAYSELADGSIRVAERLARQRIEIRFGVPRDSAGEPLRIVVVAMGKLGGHELNVSSDIDLVYLHPPGGGETDGKRVLSSGEYFTRVARRITQLIGTVTADGFVFRVDTRLRPFGESGPPVTSLDALERYWIEHARDWERHAMVKARVVTGSAASRERFEAYRCRFVFRRYMDFGAIASLRDLKRMIADGARGRDPDDVKLGRGGIRELEFIVQAFQLVRGGHEPRLQSRGLLETLATLERLGLVPADDAHALADAYRYLRRVENGLQAMRDEQTHVLPASDKDRARLVLMLGATDPATLTHELDSHRRVVARCFDALFDGEGIGAPTQVGEVAASGMAPAADKRHDSANGSGAAPTASGHAVASPQVSLSHPSIVALLARPGLARRSELARSRVTAVMPRVVDAANAQAHPEQALERTLGFVEAVIGRSGYLQILIDRPAALERLVRVFCDSVWVAAFLTRHPILVDEILRPHADGLPADADAWRERVGTTLATLVDADLERQMSALRHFRQVHELRIALAWLDGRLPIMQVSDHLSWLAESIVETVMTLVEAPLVSRYGRPHCGDGPARRPVGFATIAYGKLGGIELGHGSDLDLVFLHDSDGANQVSDGAEPIANTLWHARLVRKFSHFMTTSTEAGALYEIDLRLRPNGGAGLLVTSIDAFAGYQRDRAWTWEHQALLRARSIAGDPALRERFERLRVEILRAERAASELATSVAEMRARMYAARPEAPVGRMHLKRDPGGITDVEFVVQYLALAHAAAHPGIVRYSDNVRVIEAARDAGVLDPVDAAALHDVWLALRERLYAEALAGGGPVVPLDDQLDDIAARVRALRTRFLGPVAVPSSTASSPGVTPKSTS